MRPLLHKKYIFWALTSAILLMLLYGVAHIYVKHKIAQAITNEQSSKMKITYNDLSLSLLNNQLRLTNLSLLHKAVVDSAKIGSVVIDGFQYIHFLRTGNIAIENIEITGLSASFYTKDTTGIPKKNPSPLKKQITVEHFQLSDADMKLIDIRNNSILISGEHVDLGLQGIKVSSSTIHNQIPFTYSTYILEADNLKTSVGLYENLTIDHLKADGAIAINGLELKTKYSKAALQKHITKERDWVHLKVPEATLSKLDFLVEQDSFSVEIPSVVLKGLDLEMYRNKLMPDDYTLKDMFGKSIRNLPFGLNIPCLMIENGKVSYSELVALGTTPGELLFTEITSVIKNISSTGTKPLSIKNKAKLMGVAPIALDWSFYQENGAHLFKASGVISNFDTEKLDSFLKPNLRAQAEGTIDALYFTISGDEFVSSGDLKMSYSDFSFVVLKKDRLGVNKLLTALVNIFTNDGSKTDEFGFRHAQIKVERDPTKSFFNYLWLNVKAGILHTFTGNGKKE
ncbi:hypothetical protein [Cellulophaga sp. Z1A5H]|uniref:hypothetical protein n=1 Tax=Cellulophaga sp. Z1A5H TaxID=2687291 RepID=UPI0013FD7CA8|nr:hypothetical protein [Cellulophaga sp. Z1A5H]